MMPRPPMTAEMTNKILDLNRRGLSLVEIERKTGYSQAHVHYTLRRQGVATNRRAAANAKHVKVHELAAEGKSFRQIASEVKMSKTHARELAKRRRPDAKPEPVAACGLPESWNEDSPPFHIDRPGVVLLLNDVHVPFQVNAAVEQAVEYGKDRGANTILLNGDILDFHSVSRFPHDGSKLTYAEEIRLGTQFLQYLRGQFPKADIVYKLGNHEERLEKYILSRAEALFGIEKITVQALLDFERYGVQLVGDQRLVKIGKLNALHGHEYGNGNSPVSAARWLLLRTKANSICGHLHQSSETSENTVEDESIVAWSVGCLCGLKPRYRRFNAKWQHGFACVDLSTDGTYHVDNRKFSRGRLV